MGFLDPKPQTAAGLDTAVKNAITTPGTETATALNATYGPEAEGMKTAIANEAFMTTLIFGE